MPLGVPNAIPLHIRKTITFDDTAGGGEEDTNVVVATITGRVHVFQVFARCTTDLVGATATISLGTPNDTDLFIALTTATDVDANDWWTSTTPTAGSVKVPDALVSVLLGEDLVIEPLTAGVESGVLVFDIWYEPITDDGALA
jgi:hypothetical protein